MSEEQKIKIIEHGTNTLGCTLEETERFIQLLENTELENSVEQLNFNERSVIMYFTVESHDFGRFRLCHKLVHRDGGWRGNNAIHKNSIPVNATVKARLKRVLRDRDFHLWFEET